MSGYEVCAALRQRFRATELPIILVTAKDRVQDVVAGFEVGANDYLTKPVSKGELIARIRSHLRLARVNAATTRFVPFEFLTMLG
jgi:two-component system sensor histidine kinase ChiS